MATNTSGTRTQRGAAPSDLARPGRAASPGSIALTLCVGMIVLAPVVLPQYVAASETIAYLRPASGPSSAPQRASNHSSNHSETEVQAAAGRPGADFGRERASREAHQIANWIVHSADNLGLPFVIVDKIDARIFVFNAGGRLQGAAPALLGSARGDHTVPGIGDQEYADMRPEERTTPAGRFVAALGLNIRGEDVVWVDYEGAVSLHRVITSKPEERRLERLATPTPLDNRISFGCINVPRRFYENVVSPAFSGSDGIVYVLPETRPAREVFGSYEVEERSGRTYAGRTAAPR